MITKVRQHPTQNESLLFETSSPGKVGISFLSSMFPLSMHKMRLAPRMCGRRSRTFRKSAKLT